MLIRIPKNEAMTIYISGPVTGCPDAVDRFALAEAFLKTSGARVLNPMHMARLYPDLDYQEYMSLDLTFIDMADQLFMLRGWKDSPGARMEKKYAEDKGKEIIYQ